MELAKREFPDVSCSWCKQFQYFCMLKTSAVWNKSLIMRQNTTGVDGPKDVKYTLTQGNWTEALDLKLMWYLKYWYKF